MKQKTYGILLLYNSLLLVLVLGLSIIRYLHSLKDHQESVIITQNNEVEVKDSTSFLYKEPKEGLMEALEYYEVKHPQIVYAQAILETGNFKSTLLTNNNNLFGLYNSRKGEYYSFDHWSNSVKAYKDFIQYRYKPLDNQKSSHYYNFLDKIGYAKDPDYTSKLKQIVNQININNDKRRSK